MARLALQTAARAGTIELVNGYRESVGLELGQVYRARPKKLTPPSAYIDRITEGIDSFTREEGQRTVLVALRVVWGLYDAGDAVDQRDRFVDGFYGWVKDHPDAFGGNATCSPTAVTDDPDFSPEWIEGDGPYFMTEIVLEGFAAT